MTFCRTYPEAQSAFISAAETAGLRVVQTRIVAPHSPELFQAYAFLKRDPEKLLMHVCGVHGAEGYAGSAVQIAFLKKMSPLHPLKGPSLLFVHPLNPFGMDAFRRANGQNVDLNRNCIRSPVINANYALFDRYLNPVNRSDLLLGPLKALFHSWRLGKAKTSQAIASGQSSHPRGAFYTGAELQREIRLLQNFLRSHFSAVKQLVAIDFHTGLGNFAAELIFADEDRNAEAASFIQRVLGRDITRPNPAEGVYEAVGRFSDSIRDALPKAQLQYFLQEMGTRSESEVLRALRLEGMEWRNRGEEMRATEKISNLMLETFCPSEKEWRDKILALGAQRLEQCLHSFSQ